MIVTSNPPTSTMACVLCGTVKYVALIGGIHGATAIFASFLTLSSRGSNQPEIHTCL